jgi:hypothetical protein
MSLKKLIREQTVGRKVTLRKTVKTFKTQDGEDYEVMFVQPTRGTHKEIVNRSIDAEGNVDGVSLQSWAIIYLTLDPETEKPVFTENDFTMLEQQPSGSWVEEFAAAALAMVSGFGEDKLDPKVEPES